MRRILILEDDPIRHVGFRRRFGEPVIVETAAEAIKLLADEQWDALFLDHDLGGQVYVESGPGTGYEVAQWLELHPERIPPHVFLHSLNIPGRARMKQALPMSVVQPFAWMRHIDRERLSL